MRKRLSPLASQVIVITGATSGIGLTTARMAAQRGASLVLAARDSQALDELAQQLRRMGAQALAVPADVGVREDVVALGRAAVQRFGRIDTWINNAGVSVYGRLEDVPLQDQQQLFQTNFWGVVHGSMVALALMKERGGAIINLGSELSDRAVPLQGMYSASKHAVKGFTDALRMEVEKERLPLSVTLVKPAGVDTLFTSHARNYLENEPELPAPVYAPELAAGAILHAAQHAERDVYVGGASRAVSLAANLFPRLLDRFMHTVMFRQQQSSRPAASGRSDSLYQPHGGALMQRQGGRSSKVHEASAYTFLSTRGRPLALSLLAGGALLAAWKISQRGDKAAAHPA